MPKIKYCLLLFILITEGLVAVAQKKDTLQQPAYLGFQTGFMLNSFNSVGIRIAFEYQKDLGKRTQFSMLFDHNSYGGDFPTGPSYSKPASLDMFSFNYHYKARLIQNDRMYITFGLGAGIVHAYWDGGNKFGPTLNTNMTLNIRVSKRVYIELPPLLILLPTTRFYASTLMVTKGQPFVAGNIVPIGFKVKL